MSFFPSSVVSATAVWAAFVVFLVEEITLYQRNAFFPLEYFEIPPPSPPSVTVENWNTGYQKLFHSTFPQKEYFHCATEMYVSVLRLTLQNSVHIRGGQTQMGSCPSTVLPIHSYQTLLISFWLPVLTGKCLVRLSWRKMVLFLLLLIWPKLKHLFPSICMSAAAIGCAVWPEWAHASLQFRSSLDERSLIPLSF